MAEWQTISREPAGEEQTSIRVVRDPKTRKNYIVTYASRPVKVQQKQESQRISNQGKIEKYIYDKLQKYPNARQIQTADNRYILHDGKIRGSIKIQYKLSERTRTKIEMEVREIDRHEQQTRAIMEVDIYAYMRGRWSDGTTAEFETPVRSRFIEGFEQETKRLVVRVSQRQILSAGMGFERIYEFTDEDSGELTVIKAIA